MSRDWTPFENYLIEQRQIKEGRGNLFDFLENLKFVDSKGNEVIVNSPEEMTIRRQFPVLGRLLMDDFPELHEKLSKIEGGLDLLHQKDLELAKCIDSKGHGYDKESYLMKWFTGKLDENFYYSERNNQLFVDEMVKEAEKNHFLKNLKNINENQLTGEEYNVLNEIASKTKMDCWFYIEQDPTGVDYIYDLEEGKFLSLKDGISLLVDGLDCKENYDSCFLTPDEDKVFRGLLKKFDIPLEDFTNSYSSLEEKIESAEDRVVDAQSSQGFKFKDIEH